MQPSARKLAPEEIKQAYQEIEQSVAAWAETQPDVLAVVVVGSRARLDHPADEYSDLDFILYILQPQVLANQSDWLKNFGEYWAASMEWAGTDPEWMVIYPGGIKVDFVLSGVPQQGKASLGVLLSLSPHQVVLRRGIRVLVDKLSAPGCVYQSLPEEPPSHPDPQEFNAAVNQFLVASSRAARLIRRSDLWRAKQACDCELKEYLLVMLAWHARAVNGLRWDTWYDGRFIAEWADRRALVSLPDTFGRYDQQDLKRALLATLELYSRLGRSTADRLGYSYPEQAEDHIWTYIALLLNGLA